MRGIFWCLSSLRAISNGSVSPSNSTITGAPIAICNALVPRMRARSYFVIKGVVTRSADAVFSAPYKTKPWMQIICVTKAQTSSKNHGSRTQCVFGLRGVPQTTKNKTLQKWHLAPIIEFCTSAGWAVAYLLQCLPTRPSRDTCAHFPAFPNQITLKSPKSEPTANILNTQWQHFPVPIRYSLSCLCKGHWIQDTTLATLRLRGGGRGGAKWCGPHKNVPQV